MKELLPFYLKMKLYCWLVRKVTTKKIYQSKHYLKIILYIPFSCSIKKLSYFYRNFNFNKSLKLFLKN